MPTLLFRSPDPDEQVTVTLEPGAAVLLGRHPDPKCLNRGGIPTFAPGALSILRMSSQRVSSNHLLAYCTKDKDKEFVWVHDLGSRNGSLVQLQPRQLLQLGSDSDLVVELATIPPGDPSVDGPKPIDWAAERNFSAAVSRAVSSWLKSLGMTAVVMPVPRNTTSEPESTDEVRLPLADQTELRIAVRSETTQASPWSVLLDKLQSYIHEQNSRFEQLQGHEEGFILASRALREAHQRLTEAATRGQRVMLLGPTGAGKDRLARCYHLHSRQHSGPYATLNCALLKENLLYAQLFGAKKGSFTGCVSDIAGIVEASHEGTLFLDEIGDLDMDVQKALLRFLDSRGEYQRLGEPRTRRVNVQIVCATNVDLDDPQKRLGHFRDDLWYRLAVKVVRIPPLRERRDDITAYLRTRTLPASSLRIYDALTPAALQLVLQDAWPGNFRDLENFVERLPAASRQQSIDLEDCAAALREGRGGPLKTDSEPELRPGAAPPGSWQEVSAIAISAFIKDHGLQPRSWGQIQLYTEKYLKPVFVAHAIGLSQLDDPNKSHNYSELARRLNIADGTTVKMHLQRYLERFVKKRPEP